MVIQQLGASFVDVLAQIAPKSEPDGECTCSPAESLAASFVVFVCLPPPPPSWLFCSPLLDGRCHYREWLHAQWMGHASPPWRLEPLGLRSLPILCLLLPSYSGSIHFLLLPLIGCQAFGCTHWIGGGPDYVLLARPLHSMYLSHCRIT